MRLLLDEMLDKEIAVQLRRRGVAARAVQEAEELQGLADDALLRAAAAAGEVLATDNVRDFSALHARCLADGEDHAGLLFASPARFPRAKRTVGLWVQALHAFASQHTDDAAMRNDCHWLQRAD